MLTNRFVQSMTTLVPGQERGRRSLGKAPGIMARATAVLAAFGLAALAEAAERKVEHAVGKKNNDAVKYTDYHIVITSDTNMTIKGGKLYVHPAGTYHDPTTIAGNGTRTVSVDWTGLNVQMNSTIGGVVKFNQREKNEYKVQESWTRPSRGTTFVPVASLGLDIDDVGNYLLTNANSTAVDYSGVRYVVQPGELPQTADDLAKLLAEIADGASFPFSWTSLVPGSGTVGPNSSTPSLIDLSITTGEHFYSFMTTHFTGDPADVTYTWQGHEQQAFNVPATSAWGLTVMFAVIAIAAGMLLRTARGARNSIAVCVLLLAGSAGFATPPKPNQAELDRWNKNGHKGKNNCYNYATNVLNDKYSQPGGATDPNWPPQGVGPNLTADEWCAKIIARAIDDGLTVVQGSSTPGDAEPSDSNLIALVVKPGGKGKDGPGDYHFYRRDGNGGWSHKPGGSAARTQQNFDEPPAAGANVTDPRNPAQTGGYTRFCAYLHVPKNPPPNLVSFFPDSPHDGVLCIQLEKSGVLETPVEILGQDSMDLLEHLPTQSPSNEVPDPATSSNPRGVVYHLFPGDGLVGQMAPLVWVSQGVVGFYSDQDGVPPRFYADDNGLEAFLRPAHVVPAVSSWGFVVFVLTITAFGVFVLRSRYAGAVRLGRND